MLFQIQITKKNKSTRTIVEYAYKNKYEYILQSFLASI